MKARSLVGLARAFAPAWVRRPGTPVRAVAALTHRCNLRCGFCHSWKMPEEAPLSAEEWGRLFAAMPGLVWLDLTGGELFTRPDIQQVLEQVLANTPALRVLHFPTNGWFTERVLAATRLIQARRPELELLITVSVDGPEALHDELRGQAGSFRRALQTWRALRAEGAPVYIGTTVCPDNVDALETLRGQLSGQLAGFTDADWHWNRVQVSELFFGNGHVQGAPPRQDAVRVRRQLARRWPPRSPVDLMEGAFLVNLQAWLDGEALGLTCQALHGSCFLSPQGWLYPCHVWDKPLADLRAMDFDMAAAWALGDVTQARAGAERLDCGGCFTPCEAYPTLAGSPLKTARLTATRALALAGRAS